MKSFTFQEVENQYVCHYLSVWFKQQKFTFAQSKLFPPKHKLPIRENSSLEQAAFWHQVKVVCWPPTPLKFLLYVSTINHNWSIDLCLLFFSSSFCNISVFVHFSLFKKKCPWTWSMTGAPWTRSMKVVHGPGPKWGSMDPWSMFCPHRVRNRCSIFKWTPKR